MNIYLGPSKEKGDAYRSIKVYMPSTNKQFTSDFEYSGIAGSKDKAMSQESSKNAIISTDRGKKGRTFTPSGPKTAVSSKDVNVVLKKQMSEIEGEEPREGLKEIATSGEIRPNILVKNQELGISYNEEKLDPKLLDAFKDNPYTHPLDSFSFANKVDGLQNSVEEEIATNIQPKVK